MNAKNCLGPMGMSKWNTEESDSMNRVFKFNQAQVTGYFKHLRFRIHNFINHAILIHQSNRDLSHDLFKEIIKCQLMKIINKQCGYYMRLLCFEARAFLAGKSAHGKAQRQICFHVKVST